MVATENVIFVCDKISTMRESVLKFDSRKCQIIYDDRPGLAGNSDITMFECFKDEKIRSKYTYQHGPGLIQAR